MIRWAFPSPRGSILWMAAGVCVCVVTLTWYGYHGMQEWQRSSAQLTARRSNETADLLVTALTHDMHGVQESILASARLDEAMLDPPYELITVAAGAFAKYPYPESFFGWRSSRTDAEVWFFNRSDRPPAWMPPPVLPTRFPVTLAGAGGEIGARLMSRIRADADRGRRFSCFETQLGGQAYQIVATLRYHDQFREQLDNVFGFTVNLDWVRRHYFPELTSQVAHIGSAGTGLDLSVLDDGRTSVTRRQVGAPVGPTNSRAFELLFIDPRVVALDPPPDLPRRIWFAQVTVAEDPTLAAAIRGANWTLGVAALAAVALAVGFALTGRAVRAAAALAEMRTEFVSTVTHELKTPIATIRAAGDTLASGRIVSASTSREYAEIVVQEAKRLTRLVENLLAYGRITDVAEAYALEPIALRDVAARALDAFRSQLAIGNFHVELDIPEELAPVRADRTAIELLFDNLLDNAIRYSDQRRFVRISASARDGFVDIEIADQGVGIPADEIDRVLRKFVRGRLARSGGTGLGLAIVSRIVRDHGGTIAIASVLGEGTTVTASIPKASESDEKANSRD